MTSRLKRYDASKKGSFHISLTFYDWELSIVIGSLRATRLEHSQRENPSKAYITYLERLEDKFSKALGQVLKAEFRDLKLGETTTLDDHDQK